MAAEASRLVEDETRKSFVGIIGVVCLCLITGVVAWRLQTRRSASSEPLPFSRVVHSRFQVVSPWLLCCIRCLCALYCLGVLLYGIASKPMGVKILFFFTVWNWTLLAAYFAVTGLASLFWLRSNRPAAEPAPKEEPPCERHWWWTATVCQSTSSLIATNVLMVDVVLWAVLFPTTSAENRGMYFEFTNMNMHVMNFFLFAMELILHDIPPRARDVGVVLFFALAYAAFTVLRVLVVHSTAPCIVSKCERWESGHLVWPYFFLDTSSPWSPVGYLGLVMANWLFYKIALLFRKSMERRFGTATTQLAKTPAVVPAELEF